MCSTADPIASLGPLESTGTCSAYIVFREAIKRKAESPEGFADVPPKQLLDFVGRSLSVFVRDLSGSTNGQIVVESLRACGHWLHTNSLATLVSEANVTLLLGRIAHIMATTPSKSVATWALWCVAIQSIPAHFFSSVSLTRQLIEAMQTANFRFGSSSSCRLEFLQALLRLLNRAPSSIASAPIASVWLGDVIQISIDIDTEMRIREKAEGALNTAWPILASRDQTQVQLGDGDVAAILEKMELVINIDERNRTSASEGIVQTVLRIWRNLVHLLGHRITKNNLINMLLKIPEKTFLHPAAFIRSTSFESWRSLVDNFADTQKNHLLMKKRVGLLLLPLKVGLEDTSPDVRMAAAETWRYLVRSISNAGGFKDLICAENQCSRSLWRLLFWDVPSSLAKDFGALLLSCAEECCSNSRYTLCNMCILGSLHSFAGSIWANPDEESARQIAWCKLWNALLHSSASSNVFEGAILGILMHIKRVWANPSSFAEYVLVPLFTIVSLPAPSLDETSSLLELLCDPVMPPVIESNFSQRWWGIFSRRSDSLLHWHAEYLQHLEIGFPDAAVHMWERLPVIIKYSAEKVPNNPAVVQLLFWPVRFLSSTQSFSNIDENSFIQCWRSLFEALTPHFLASAAVSNAALRLKGELACEIRSLQFHLNNMAPLVQDFVVAVAMELLSLDPSELTWHVCSELSATSTTGCILCILSAVIEMIGLYDNRTSGDDSLKLKLLHAFSAFVHLLSSPSTSTVLALLASIAVFLSRPEVSSVLHQNPVILEAVISIIWSVFETACNDNSARVLEYVSFAAPSFSWAYQSSVEAVKAKTAQLCAKIIATFGPLALPTELRLIEPAAASTPATCVPERGMTVGRRKRSPHPSELEDAPPIKKQAKLSAASANWRVAFGPVLDQDVTTAILSEMTKEELNALLIPLCKLAGSIAERLTGPIADESRPSTSDAK